jgi:hypothetical protein
MDNNHAGFTVPANVLLDPTGLRWHKYFVSQHFPDSPLANPTS